MQSVYGMHNWPGAPTGQFGMRKGPMMASYDIFDITVAGRGSHGAMPHQGVDPVLIASHIVTNLQTITARNADPLEAMVVSVTQIHGGDAYNVIPDEVQLKGTVRSFKPEHQDLAEDNIKRISHAIAAAHGAEAIVHYERRYPPTVNTARETEIAAGIATAVVGSDQVNTDVTPVMGSEDFAFMLQEKPGCYVLVGGGEDRASVHNPHYDFNDEILPIGASYWAHLVEETMQEA